MSLNKLDVFRDILEDGGGYRLAGRCPMSDLIPFILSEEKCKLREEVNGKDVAVIFDGTSRLGKSLLVCDLWTLTAGLCNKDLSVCSF